jgi:hypothetical protein
LKKIVRITKTAFYTAFLLLLIYGLFLLLDGASGLIVASIILAACFLRFYTILIIGKRILSAKYERFSLLVMLLFVMIFSVAFSISNYVLHTSLTHELPARVKNQYYTEALFFGKEYLIKRISFLKTLETKTTDQAVVFHEPGDGDLAMQAISHIRKVQALNERLIDVHKPLQVTVILYRNPFIFQKHLPHHSYQNLHALYVPAEETVHLLVTKQMVEDQKRFLELIAHEYTHHWIVSYLDEKGLDNRHLPRWFEEGIAEYAGMKSVRKIPRFVPLNLIPFTRLDSVEEWAYENRGNSPHLPYRQSYYAIDQLIRDGNQSKMKSLLLNIDQNFYRSFEYELDESVLEFEVRFLRDEMREYRENSE